MLNALPKPPARRLGATAALAVASALAIAAPAGAAEDPSLALIKSMTDFLAAQKSMSFDVESTLEVVTTDGERLALSSSGSVDLSRPDKLRATRKGGFADVEAVFDGKTLSMLGKNLNVYAQADIPGDIDHLIATLHDKFQRPLPAADLLTSDAYKVLTTGVKHVKYLGPGVILGQMCDHLAMRAGDVDLQLWIAEGDKPYPCRYTITSRAVKGEPQYSVDIHNWKSSTDAGSADFTFKPPAGAQKVDPAKLTDSDELPSHFVPKK